MWISPAYAQGVGGAEQMFSFFLPLVLIFAIFYFLMIRPQQKKMKEHQAKLSAIRRGDRIVTGGGILGRVNKAVDDNEVEVDIADGVRVRILRSTIADVFTKGEPATAAANDSDKKKSKAKRKEPAEADDSKAAE
jgi:preprotein translocase subunit YajC